MRITFLTRSIGISGGMRAVLSLSDRLAKRGHDVEVTILEGKRVAAKDYDLKRPLWQLGMPQMEAMACGCALITTDTLGSRSYADHELTALVAEPRTRKNLADSIIRLADNRDVLQRLKKAGQERIASFSWREALDKLEESFFAINANGVEFCELNGPAIFGNFAKKYSLSDTGDAVLDGEIARINNVLMN